MMAAGRTGAALRRLNGWLVDAPQMRIGSTPYLHCEEGHNRYRQQQSDEPFSVAGNIPVIHVRFPPFLWLDGASPAKV
jgi:hypothetical protein